MCISGILMGVGAVVAATICESRSFGLNSKVPTQYDVTEVTLGVQGLTEEDMGRRRGLHHHSTQMRRRDTHFDNETGTSTISIEEHAALIHVNFTWENQETHLVCRRNDRLVASSYTLIDGDREEHGTERCYYICNGTDIAGGLSTCGKLHGTFHMDDDEIYLGPVDPDVEEVAAAVSVAGHDLADAYFVYRKSNSPIDQHNAGMDAPSVVPTFAEEATVESNPHQSPRQERREVTSKADKYIELLIGLGPGFIDYHDNRPSAPGAEVFMFSIMNLVEEAYMEDSFDFDIFVNVKEVRFFRNLEDNCGMNGEGPMPCDLEEYTERRDGKSWTFLKGSGEDMLTAWNSYVRKENSGSGRARKWDAAHFLGMYDIHGDRARGGTIGRAYVDSVCGAYSTGINEVPKYSYWDVVAHELGHNLGAGHDGDGNNCDRSSYIMAASSGTGEYDRGFWSSCTTQELNERLLAKNCLGAPNNGFIVQAGDWGPCSTKCGDGEQTRQVQCMDINYNVVANDKCDGLDMRTTQSCTDNSGCNNDDDCNLSSNVEKLCGSSCKALVTIRNFGTCDSYCGDQGLVCKGAWDDVKNEECDGAKEYSCSYNFRTEIGTSDAICECGKGTAVQYEAKTGIWGQCSTTCGTGKQTRPWQCHIKGSDTVVDKSNCLAPLTSQACTDDTGCTTTYKWQVGDFSRCDLDFDTNGCGLSERKETLDCVTNTNDQVSDKYCIGLTKPDLRTEECRVTSACAAFPGDWSSCSTTCGTGEQTRDVQCKNRNTNKVVDPTLCDTLTTQECTDNTGCECSDDPNWRSWKGKSCKKIKVKDCKKCKRGICPTEGCPKKCGVCT